MTWLVIGAIIGGLIATLGLGRATRGRRLGAFDWVALGLAVAAGSILLGGLLLTASRLLSL